MASTLTPGRLSSAILLASGAAAVLIPDRVAAQLETPVTSPRGRAEVRAGLGGTYVGLGAYALLSGAPAARRAVAATWWGAAASRAASLKLDGVKPDASYWTYLALELACGAAALRR